VGGLGLWFFWVGFVVFGLGGGVFLVVLWFLWWVLFWGGAFWVGWGDVGEGLCEVVLCWWVVLWGGMGFGGWVF